MLENGEGIVTLSDTGIKRQTFGSCVAHTSFPFSAKLGNALFKLISPISRALTRVVQCY